MNPPSNPHAVEAAMAWREYQAEVRAELPAPHFRATATVERGAWLPCADGAWRWFDRAVTWTWMKGQNNV
jgi:hypothetical protein